MKLTDSLKKWLEMFDDCHNHRYSYVRGGDKVEAVNDGQFTAVVNNVPRSYAEMFSDGWTLHDDTISIALSEEDAKLLAFHIEVSLAMQGYGQ